MLCSISRLSFAVGISCAWCVAIGACGDDGPSTSEAACEGASCDDAAIADATGGGDASRDAATADAISDSSRDDASAVSDAEGDGSVDSAADGSDASGTADGGDAASCASPVHYTSVVTLFGRDFCALDTAGAVRCWAAAASPSPPPAPMTNLTGGVVEITAGATFFCALKSSGQVLCWGDNTSMQLGDPGFAGASRATPTVVSGTGNAKHIVAGFAHTCAILDTKGVRCWGSNSTGVLGNAALGVASTSATPVDVDGVSGATSLTASQYLSCARLEDASVKCWGWSAVTPANSLSGIAEVKVGDYGGCARTNGGALRCWGEARAGTYTAPTLGDAQDVPGLGAGFQSFFVRNYGACVLMNAGSVKCWGLYFGGRTPAQDYLQQPSTPVDLTSLGANIAAIRGSSSDVVAFDSTTHTFLKVTQQGGGSTESAPAATIEILAPVACGGQRITGFKVWASQTRPSAVIDQNDNLLTSPFL